MKYLTHLKLIVLVLGISLPIFLEAQTYSIPCTEQPQWLFPMWFEDGLGRRDTLYLGYDLSSEEENTDLQFCEDPQIYPLDSFGVYWRGIGGKGLKINVIPTLPNGETIRTDIVIIGARAPFTMSWDHDLLNSMELPFPMGVEHPTSWGYLICDDPFGLNCPGDRFYMTDTLPPPLSWLYNSGKDTFVMNGVTTSDFATDHTLFIEPWGTEYVYDSPSLVEVFGINIQGNFLNLVNHSGGAYNISGNLVTMDGRSYKLFKNEVIVNSHQIPIPENLSTGMYLIVLAVETDQQIYYSSYKIMR